MLGVLVTSVALAQEPSKIVVNYQGELVDQDAKAVSGVLPLIFKIYTQEKGKKAIAQENHFVSVVDGSYEVVLGNASEIRSKGSNLWVGVELGGEELVRQKVVGQALFEPKQPLNVVRTEEIGLHQGEQFKLSCPEGYMVTGIEGTREEALSAIRLVCTKIF